MPRLAWLTPDTTAGSIVCRRLHVPVELMPAVNGALLHLVETFNWELHGTMTVEEAIDLCQAMIDDYWLSEDTCLIGSINPYANAVLPVGVLACDGSSYLRTSYPLLYAVLDAVYITDADNFVLPDLRGRGIIGTGEGDGLTSRSMGDQGGEETHQLAIAEIPSHSHEVHSHDPNIDLEGAGVPDVSAGIPIPFGNTGDTGGDGSHENMPPFEALTWGIVAIETGVPCGEGGNPYTTYPSVHVADTTSKTTIVQHTVAAGSLGVDGLVDLTVDLACFNDSGGGRDVTIEGEFGSSSIGSVKARLSNSGGNFSLLRVVFTLQNDGADDSQLAGIYVLNAGRTSNIGSPALAPLGDEAPGGVLSMATNVASEDTSLDQILKVSVKMQIADIDLYFDTFSAKVLQP